MKEELSRPLNEALFEDACRGIDLHGSLKAAWKNMETKGVKRIHSTDIELT